MLRKMRKENVTNRMFNSTRWGTFTKSNGVQEPQPKREVVKVVRAEPRYLALVVVDKLSGPVELRYQN